MVKILKPILTPTLRSTGRMAQQAEAGLHVNEMLTRRSTCRALTALWAERFFRKSQNQSALEYFDYTRNHDGVDVLEIEHGAPVGEGARRVTLCETQPGITGVRIGIADRSDSGPPLFNNLTNQALSAIARADESRPNFRACLR